MKKIISIIMLTLLTIWPLPGLRAAEEATLVLTAPSGSNQTYENGQTVNITWTSTNIGYMVIDIKAVNSNFSAAVASITDPSQGAYQWNINYDDSDFFGRDMYLEISGNVSTGGHISAQSNTFRISNNESVTPNVNVSVEKMVSGNSLSGGSTDQYLADIVISSSYNEGYTNILPLNLNYLEILVTTKALAGLRNIKLRDSSGQLICQGTEPNTRYIGIEPDILLQHSKCISNLTVYGGITRLKLSADVVNQGQYIYVGVWTNDGLVFSGTQPKTIVYGTSKIGPLEINISTSDSDDSQNNDTNTGDDNSSQDNSSDSDTQDDSSQDDSSQNDSATHVKVCHTLGNGNYQTLEIDSRAEAAHLAHGDIAGECAEDSNTGTDDRLTDRLRGKILLQVQRHGEAWYVRPDNGRKVYLKDGAAAYGLMRDLGLGITNADLEKIPVGFEDRFECTDTDSDGLCDKLEDGIGTNPNNPDSDGDGFKDGEEVRSGHNPLGSGAFSYNNSLTGRLKGKIVIQVQAHGEAWYINPEDGKRYYMPDGPSAYQIMRFLSLGITDSDLSKIASQ